jgi:hypothetical protein
MWRGYYLNSNKAISKTFCINAFLTATKVPTNKMETKLFNEACGTVHLITTIIGNLEILDITIAKNTIKMPAFFVHFCVNAKVTCMLDASCALEVVIHNHLCCDTIRTQHFTIFFATLERIMFIL